MSWTTYFGPPGTGKTTKLISIAEARLREGIHPLEIAYVAFSRRAAREARERAGEALGLNEEALSNWRTLHSMASRQLSLGRSDFMTRKDWNALGELLSLNFSLVDEAGRLKTIRNEIGYRIQSAYYLRRSRLQSFELDELVMAHGHEAREIQRFQRALEEYKTLNGKYDYADLLDAAPGPGCRVVILDEAQDLTPQQWAYFHRIAEDADEVHVAGDDEQALFEWAGADVESFLALPGEKEVLDVSHRLPSSVYVLARTISDRIRTKQPKDWRSTARPGLVTRNVGWEDINLSEGTWLLLARSRYQLPDFISFCKRRGVRYVASGIDSVKETELQAIRLWEQSRRGRILDESEQAVVEKYSGPIVERVMPDGISLPPWYDALAKIPDERRKYYRSVVQTNSGEELTSKARVRIDTIHSAKGAEADHVALSPEITEKIYRGMRQDPDAEHRVWYVAVTRARESLNILRAETSLIYAL